LGVLWITSLWPIVIGRASPWRQQRAGRRTRPDSWCGDAGSDGTTGPRIERSPGRLERFRTAEGPGLPSCPGPRLEVRIIALVHPEPYAASV